jgi:hypothetical protein
VLLSSSFALVKVNLIGKTDRICINCELWWEERSGKLLFLHLGDNSTTCPFGQCPTTKKSRLKWINLLKTRNIFSPITTSSFCVLYLLLCYAMFLS